MSKFSFAGQPGLKVLSEKNIQELFETSLDILEDTGVLFHTNESLDLLSDFGCDVNKDTKIAKFPRNKIIDAIEKTPESFTLYNAYGEPAAELGANTSYFDPGSAGIRFLEQDGVTSHQTTGADLEKVARLTEMLDNIDFASTSIIPHDMDEMIADSYRVYLLLKNTRKPFVTGAFSQQGMLDIYELLAAAAGGKEQLAEKPRALLDVCSLSPLKWTEISCHNLVDGAKLGIPMQTLSVPLIGATAPATFYGCVLMHTIESLSGIMLVQNINPGNKLVYGGAPMYFDMRYNTTSLNSIETNLIGAAYAQVGKYFGIPVHTYSGLSDAKTVDAQAGLETGISATVSAMAGIDVISGVGMLEFCNTFSLEKLVVDNDIIGIVKRLAKGIERDEETMAADLIREMGSTGDYLSSDHTLDWYRREPYWPSAVIDRKVLPDWQNDGCPTSFDRAKEIVEKKLSDWKAPALPEDIFSAVESAWMGIKSR